MSRVQQLAAWLFFISVPIANVPALVFGALTLFLLSGVSAGEKKGPPQAVFFIFLTYVVVATASLSWTFEVGSTLTALKREVYIPTLTFFAFYCLRFPSSRAVTLSGLLIGLIAVVQVFVCMQLPLPEKFQTVIQHYNPGVGDFSTYAVLLIPVFYLAFVASNSNRVSKLLFYVAASGFLLFAGYLTRNRMFWPATAITLFALFVFGLVSKKAKLGRKHAVMVVAAACILVTFSLAFAFVKNYMPGQVSVQGRVEKVVDQDPRWEIWQYWVKLIEARPILGYGYGRYVALRHSDVPIPNNARVPLKNGHGHNIFLNQWSEIGAIGLVAFLLMWILLWRQYWRYLRHPRVRHLAVAGLVLMIAYLTKNMTDDFYTRRNLLLFWALNGLWLRAIHDGVRETFDADEGKDFRLLKRILVIRRDNIGDLVCTLPMIRLLRDHFPNARIDALVNSYNYPVLDKTPLLDNVYQYTKGKHRAGNESLLAVYRAKLHLFWTLRSNQYEIAILPGSGYSRRGVQFARFIGAKQILGFYENDDQRRAGLTLPVDIGPYGKRHEAEYCCGLLRPLGIDATAPASELRLSDDELKSARENLGLSARAEGPGFIGIHISARKPSNRWQEADFVELIHRLWRETGKPLLLFWSPGSADHPHHPGDDAMASRILEACNDVAIVPCATARLRELMAGLALCDLVICSDGGAMHVAAGLGKPVVCLFGDSNAWQWHPWGVPYRLLQTADRHVESITVDDVMDAYRGLTRSLVASNAYNS